MPSIPASNTLSTILGPTGPACQVASVLVGPSAVNNVTVTVTGISTYNQINLGSSPDITNVFLQPRQAFNASEDFGFPDQFAVQYMSQEFVADNDLRITFRVRRLDADGGWGQNLQVDILLFTFLLPPIQ